MTKNITIFIICMILPYLLFIYKIQFYLKQQKKIKRILSQQRLPFFKKSLC